MDFKLSAWDIALTKLSVFFVTLFLVSIWSGFADWITSTHWAFFLVAGLILAIKPLKTAFKK